MTTEPMFTVGSFDHLDRLTDDRGLFERSLGRTRVEGQGYRTEDNARMVVVALRDPEHAITHRLRDVAIEFVFAAFEPDGRCRSRMDRTGGWVDQGSTGDCWGRAMWALGSVVRHHPDTATRDRALTLFEVGARQRSAWPRSMAFAALGAGEVMAVLPDRRPARTLLIDTINAIGTAPHGTWSWPERRLTTVNATLAEALLVAGSALGNEVAVDRGLTMLAWLLSTETREGHLSVTGVDGRGPAEHDAQFEQHPLEVAAMADACWQACTITEDHTWTRGIAAAAGWFQGDNDAGVPMFDEVTGGAYDGLRQHGVDANESAEAALSLISTMQRARAFMPIG